MTTSEPSDMTAYVIERDYNSELHYWNGRHANAQGFVPQHSEACRFARAEDASIVLAWLLDGVGRVVQHLWAVTALILLLLPFGAAPADAQTVIDHTSAPLFDQIPASYKQKALDLQIEFLDRSVGRNLQEAIDCARQPMATAPRSCTTYKPGTSPEPWEPTISNGVAKTWPGFGQPSDITCDGWTGGLITGVSQCARSYFSRRLDVIDGMAIFPDYTMGSFGNPADWYADLTPTGAGAWLAFGAEHPTKRQLWMSPSVAKVDQGGSLRKLKEFADDGTRFAQANGLVYFDFYDVVTHQPSDGSPCLSPSNEPIQCDEWGSEAAGGHITYGAGRIRLWKLWIVALAQLEGWRPGVPEPEPPPHPPLPDPETPADLTKPTLTLSCDKSILERPTVLHCVVDIEDETGVAGITLDWQAHDAAGNVGLGQTSLGHP